MISSLSGILADKSPTAITIDVGGVGYRVFISLQCFVKLPKIGDKTRLQIHTHVREDDISLYGFLEEGEKSLFQKLISVSGIGPKLALTVLSGIPPRELVNALRTEDLVRLTAIPGIGRKTAERMILELKDKLVEWGPEAETGQRPPDGKKRLYDDTLSALMNLGYNRPTAERTLSQMTFKEEASLEHLVKEALQRIVETRI